MPWRLHYVTWAGQNPACYRNSNQQLSDLGSDCLGCLVPFRLVSTTQNEMIQAFFSRSQWRSSNVQCRLQGSEDFIGYQTLCIDTNREHLKCWYFFILLMDVWTNVHLEISTDGWNRNRIKRHSPAWSRNETLFSHCGNHGWSCSRAYSSTITSPKLQTWHSWIPS